MIPTQSPTLRNSKNSFNTQETWTRTFLNFKGKCNALWYCIFPIRAIHYQIRKGKALDSQSQGCSVDSMLNCNKVLFKSYNYSYHYHQRENHNFWPAEILYYANVISFKKDKMISNATWHRLFMKYLPTEEHCFLPASTPK